MAEIGGHHYALADDRSNAVYVINVTDPAKPEYVSNVTDGNSGIVINGLLGLVALRSTTATTRWFPPVPMPAFR